MINDSKNISQRERIEAIIDQLVQLLDDIDGDADFEPSLGWTALTGNASAPIWTTDWDYAA